MSSVPDFKSLLSEKNINLTPQSIETLQVNLTKLCNQACRHCHVASSPTRKEMMKPENIKKVMELLNDSRIKILDLTGGAPELHPSFKELVYSARKLEKKVMVRHNLTVAFDKHPQSKISMLWLHDFFKDTEVEIISSLPYYREYLTDRQRGQGVFQKSILGLKELNKRGFGIPGKNLVLNLVYNPVGPYLPPDQKALEREYRLELRSKYEIEFTNLFTITNMPIQRFKEDLIRTKQFDQYMEKLAQSFNPEAAKSVMCRNMLSVSWDGQVYDCDFNQMLDIKSESACGLATLDNLNIDLLERRNISLANHCYGCTAGAGSSCGGSIA